MKNLFLISLLFVSILVFSACTALKEDKNIQLMPPLAQSEESDEGSSETDSFSRPDFTATFEIYTNGTKRIFTQAMYHNQSPTVYIEAENPSVITVKKGDTTWSDFFATLPFSLTSECLVTGTKETFCTSETKKLRFFLNEQETPQVLEQRIRPGDVLRVVYGG